MIRKAILWAVLLCPMVTTQIQAFTLVPDFRSQDLVDSRRYWDGTPLTLDELNGRPNDSLAYEFSWWYVTNTTEKKVNGIHHNLYECHTYIARNLSFVNKKKTDPQATLRLINAAYNITEIYARKATRDFSKLQDVSFQEILGFYETEAKERINELAEYTDRGRDEAKMARQEALINEELAEGEFDPSTIEYSDERLSGHLSVGLCSSIIGSDYFSNAPIGVSFHIGAGWKRHLYGIDCHMGFMSEAKKKLDTSKGWILKNDDLIFSQILFTYGYHFGSYRNPFTPFVGIGASVIEGPKIGEYENGQNEYLEKTGLHLAVGCTYDIPVKCSFYHRGTNYNTLICPASYAQRSIRLKPSFGLNYMNDGPGWFPTFNLALLFDWSGINYNK